MILAPSPLVFSVAYGIGGTRGHRIIVELIVSKEDYCWSFVLAAATLLLVSLLLFQNFASRGRTALGPTGVSCCCDFVSFKTWLNT